MGRGIAPPRGLILIWTLDHSQFAEIVAGLERYLERWPEQGQWCDLAVAFSQQPSRDNIRQRTRRIHPPESGVQPAASVS
jgi:hypothetical protein